MPNSLALLFRNMDMWRSTALKDARSITAPHLGDYKYNPNNDPSSGISHLREELLNVLKEGGVNRITIFAPGTKSDDEGIPQVKLDFRSNNFYSIPEVIECINSAATDVNHININSDFAGNKFDDLKSQRELSPYYQGVMKSMKVGQYLSFSNGQYLANPYDTKSSESVVKNPNINIGEIILDSPESLFVVKKTGKDSLECFEHNIFGHDNQNFSTGDLRRFLQEELERAEKFELSQGINNNGAAKERLANMTEEDLKEYLAESVFHNLIKILHQSGHKHFHDSAKTEFHGKVARAVAEGEFDINHRDSNGMTLLMHAASLPMGDLSLKMTNFLILDLGADVNVLDNDQNSALSLSLSRGRNNDVSETLLDRGAKNIGTPGNSGLPFDATLANGHNIRILKAFFRNGAVTIDEVFERGLLSEAVYSGVKVVEFLVKEVGLDPNRLDARGHSLLTEAMIFRNKEMAKFLIKECDIDFEKRAQVMIGSTASYSPKRLAAEYLKDQELVDLMDAKTAEIAAMKLREEEDALSHEQINELTFLDQKPADYKQVEAILEKEKYFENLSEKVAANNTSSEVAATKAASSLSTEIPSVFENLNSPSAPNLRGGNNALPSPSPTQNTWGLLGSAALLAGVAATAVLKFCLRGGSKKDDGKTR